MSSARRWLWSGLCVLAFGSLALVATPVWLIQPFAPQTFDDLWWSHVIKSAAPLLTAVALTVSAIVGWMLWRVPETARGAARRWSRAAARGAIVLLVVIAGGAAWFSRQNHFEWMFAPNHNPAFVAIADATGVDAGEPVIGVTVGSDALAFPITRIGYHHLVNTTIARKPIVATY